ncbi:hypothetical protein WICMUC_000657 [Wickerhamomyces mucosus]|uniref:PIH1 N-terminal domain-containing protein n=1 Tax=Wickerhamomyces mucosus TaxID=1378264 RepID=A0A9P8PZ31_9ASCO|nr:hypothetical protein WICMUC_000657 [Wickerhamomyces mucosus]
MLKTYQEIQNDTLELTPRAGFVVKTRLAESTSTPDRKQGTKVFINVCSDDNVPLPEIPYSPEVVFPLIMENKWEIPIVTSEERAAKDKKGELAYVYDCIISTKSMRWIQLDNGLREILVEWCLESCEIRSNIRLSRESISTPKMVSKGHIPNLKILKSDLDLNRLNKEFEKGNNLKEEPQRILEAKRLNNERTELLNEESHVDIFNLNKEQSQTSSVTKPLIEEINDMSLENNPKRKNINAQKLEEKKLDKLKFETTISKIDLNGFKLKIEIKSQITSSLDYDLELVRATNTLVLKNLSRDYTARNFELPLPSIFSDPEIKTFFSSKNFTLIIFVK